MPPGDLILSLGIAVKDLSTKYLIKGRKCSVEVILGKDMKATSLAKAENEFEWDEKIFL
jgi:hypothetical protein